MNYQKDIKSLLNCSKITLRRNLKCVNNIYSGVVKDSYFTQVSLVINDLSPKSLIDYWNNVDKTLVLTKKSGKLPYYV